MRFKFGDIAYYRPLFDGTEDSIEVMQVVGFEPRRGKYICMVLDLYEPLIDPMLCLCCEEDLELLETLTDTYPDLRNCTQPLIKEKHIDLFCFPLYNMVGKEQIKVRNAVRRRIGYSIPLKTTRENNGLD